MGELQTSFRRSLFLAVLEKQHKMVGVIRCNCYPHWTWDGDALGSEISREQSLQNAYLSADDSVIRRDRSDMVMDPGAKERGFE
jgi:hypothetical protein